MGFLFIKNQVNEYIEELMLEAFPSFVVKNHPRDSEDEKKLPPAKQRKSDFVAGAFLRLCCAFVQQDRTDCPSFFSLSYVI